MLAAAVASPRSLTSRLAAAQVLATGRRPRTTQSRHSATRGSAPSAPCVAPASCWRRRQRPPRALTGCRPVETAGRLLAVRCAHDRGVVARRDLTERIATARTREQDHRQRLLELREARLANMAGELAEGLADGEPCAVCGSCAHPNPAVRTHPVTADDIDDADDRWSSARTALETLERELVRPTPRPTAAEPCCGGRTRRG